MICHILNALAGLQEVHRKGVTQAVNGSAFNSCLLGIRRKESRNLSLLYGSLSAGKEVVASILAAPQVGAEQLRVMAPERFLATHAVLEPVDADMQVFQVHIFQGEQGRFLDAQAVVINQGKECPVAG